MEEIKFTKRNKNKVSDALDGKVSFRKLTAEEWHQYVQNYNYDDGNTPFKWLIRQKICDKGTALCLYWHLEPYFFSDPAKRTGKFENDYALLKEIEERYANGFYENEHFSFDPMKSDFFDPNADISSIPALMLEKTGGVPFDRLNVEIAFLRYPTEKERKTVEKKIKKAVAIIQQVMPDFTFGNVDAIVKAIAYCVENWKENKDKKLIIDDLSFLWFDCLQKEYGWEWIVWDWETGHKLGVCSKTRELTCLGNAIIHHTMSGFQPTSIILELFYDLKGVSKTTELGKDPYSGIGLIHSSQHLSFKESVA